MLPYASTSPDVYSTVKNRADWHVGRSARPLVLRRLVLRTPHLGMESPVSHGTVRSARDRR
eukprot:2065139-Prorocentrum_lima.AAC.1